MWSAAWLVMLAGCGSDHGAPHVTTLAPRSYVMGFSDYPPRLDTPSLIANLQMWSSRADAGIFHDSPPWTALLAGTPADSAVRANELPVAQYYRSKGFKIAFTVDVTNGLDRSAEAPELVTAGRSITEPAVQQLYRNWVAAVDTIVKPDWLGLAAETNLIRAAAPAAVYSAVVTMTNAAAAETHARDPGRALYVSVQVEVAWGRLSGSGPYVGIAQDMSDFPFVHLFGLSSYPYLAGFAIPESLPPDYYLRLVAGHALPVIVVEGGWTSASVGGVVSSPDLERRYIVKQTALLDTARAAGVFQLDFSDLDISGYPPPVSPILPLFTSLGLVDVDLNPKPALSAWDATFARPRR
jgi:hypothetical protein